MNQLTNKEICRVLCMYGLDQEIRTMDGDGHVLGIHPRAVKVSLNIIKHGQRLQGFDDGNGGLHRTYLNKDGSQLLLTPLKKITDEHAIVMIKIFGRYSDNQEYKIHYKTNTFSENFAQLYYEYEGDIKVVANFDKDGFHAISSNRGETYFFAYQELIKMGYAVPIYFGLNHWANGKTAIELGIAIERI